MRIGTREFKRDAGDNQASHADSIKSAVELASDEKGGD